MSFPRVKKTLFGALVLGALLCVSMPSSHAQGFSVTISFDETGNGTLSNTNNFFSNLPTSMITDPGPGGVQSVLFYGMLNPPGLVAGDLILLEPGGGGLLSDLLRFDPATQNGGLFVYSDTFDGADSLADVGFPTALNTNTLTLFEAGAEGSNGFSYTPTAGQPGFVAGAGGPVTYVFTSDSAVPEPSSIALLLGGAAVLGVKRYRSKRV